MRKFKIKMKIYNLAHRTPQWVLLVLLHLILHCPFPAIFQFPPHSSLLPCALQLASAGSWYILFPAYFLTALWDVVHIPYNPFILNVQFKYMCGVVHPSSQSVLGHFYYPKGNPLTLSHPPQFSHLPQPPALTYVYLHKFAYSEHLCM